MGTFLFKNRGTTQRIRQKNHFPTEFNKNVNQKE